MFLTLVTFLPLIGAVFLVFMPREVPESETHALLSVEKAAMEDEPRDDVEEVVVVLPVGGGSFGLEVGESCSIKSKRRASRGS